MERVTRAGQQAEACRATLSDATLDLHTAGTRWETNPTEQNRAEAFDLSVKQVSALRDLLAAIDGYLECARGVLPENEIAVVRYGRAEMATQLPDAVAYLRKLQLAVEVA